MKDFKRFILAVLAVLLVVFVIDQSIGLFLDKTAVFIDQPKYRRIERADEDVVILGASRAQNHYVSSIIGRECSKSVYNYGLGGVNIYTNYAILNLLVNKSVKKPRIVIWDFYYTDIVDSPGWNTELFDPLYSAYNYDDTVKEIINLQGIKKEILFNLFRTYKFNSKLQRGLKQYQPDEAGYVPLYVVHKDTLVERSSNRTGIDNQKMRYIDKFISLCKENDVQLIVFISPGYYLLDTSIPEDWTHVIEKKCSENQIPFFNYEQDSTILSHKEWFYNPLHLNDAGAKEFTKMIVNDLKNMIAENEYRRLKIDKAYVRASD